MVWAQGHDRVIGADGQIPWHLPEDAAHFKEITTGATVVMGRRTWESLPTRFRPLPHRTNVVLTRQPGWQAEGADAAASLETALAQADGDVWIIGGEAVYRAALPLADVLEVTEVDAGVDTEPDTGDEQVASGVDGPARHALARAPHIGPPWRQVDPDRDGGWRTSRSGLRYRFITLRR